LGFLPAGACIRGWPGGSIRSYPNSSAPSQDHVDAVRRLLLRGDLAVISEAEGTDGVEVPPERRARLLTHGLLVEYGTPPDITVRAHPLVRRLAERARR
jgi:hypothetical protein